MEGQEEEERTATFPKRQNRCQSNSATCADIKHYCILTFHLYCSSAFFVFFLRVCVFFFSQRPAKKPENGSLSRCCPRINWLVSNFIFPFRLRRYVRVDDLLLSLWPGSFQRRSGGGNQKFPHHISHCFV